MKKETVILQAIADTFPYGFSVVEKVFDCVQSYDRTIAILQQATADNINPFQLSNSQVVLEEA